MKAYFGIKLDSERQLRRRLVVRERRGEGRLNCDRHVNKLSR